MFASKPLASLSSTLLARKGHARPAMRPQGGGIDDLGWNDMGTSSRGAPAVLPPVLPPVLVERAALVEEVEAPVAVVEAVVEVAPVAVAPVELPPVEIAPPAPIEPRLAPLAGGKKAAFTLRLDADRHVRLRLTSAVSNRSAQQIVTAALDAFLAQQPGLDALVAGLPQAPDTDNDPARISR